MMIDKHAVLSIRRQSSLLSIAKLSIYYKREYTNEELIIMEQIDIIFTNHPYYGSRRIRAELKRQGYGWGRKRVTTMMHSMGIMPIYPKKRTSIPNKNHKTYPYLLKGVCIERVNQVWSTDITYIKLPSGFVYLLAIIDRYSRKVIAWDVSPSMDSEFCNGVLQRSLLIATPEIFNSDQGSQFTSPSFTTILENAGVTISMDGVGRYSDNIRIERLWRTVKYEDIHIHDYQTPLDVYHGLSLYFEKYNNSRLHSALGYKTPSEIYNQH